MLSETLKENPNEMDICGNFHRLDKRVGQLILTLKDIDDDDMNSPIRVVKKWVRLQKTAMCEEDCQVNQSIRTHFEFLLNFC